jgi:hypothetical protein
MDHLGPAIAKEFGRQRTRNEPGEISNLQALKSLQALASYITPA